MDATTIEPVRPLRAAGIAALFATVPAVLVSHAMIMRGASPLVALVTEALPWYGWAVMTPAIFALARRFPLDRPPRTKTFALHVLFGLGAGLIQGSLAACIGSFVDLPADAMGADYTPLSLILIWIPFGLIMYGAIASIGFALDYRARLVERERAADRLERLLVESRLGALRMQLQPHFLFNALNTVAMLVREGDGATAVRVIARFSDLLRTVLDESAPPVVTLGEELELVGRYLDIERVRFGDRLNVEIDADAPARATPVPHLLLQPIVENAVRHGIARSASAACIRIAAARDADCLRITVSDDGPGLPPVWTPAHGRGIGLRNTRERLRYMFGERASVNLRNDDHGRGAIATLEIPLAANGSP